MLRDNGSNTIRDLIDEMASAQPDSDFLICPETRRVLKFKGLQEKARELCGRFQGMGLERGDKIAFLMDNGLFTAQLFLGTMYGGFVTVPLNVRAGVSQLSYNLENCDARVVFVGHQYDALIKNVLVHVRRQVEVVFADSDSGPTVSEPPATAGSLLPLAANDPAMLIYTSGSTGQPKGPIHTHRSVLAHGKNSIQAHQLTAADRSLLVLPLYHINAECVTLIPTLMSGGSVVLPRGFAVSEFWNWVDTYRCTWSAVVPTIISQLLELHGPKANHQTRTFEYVRFLRSSSAPLSPSLHREFIRKFALPLIQAMGSSEAGNVFSNPVPPGENKIGSPGLPWGFQAKIVDRDGAELPMGEPGEVLLRGDGMMQGYYKDPAGSAAALDPEGWLHTGDLAYRDKDGYFFVIGRSKELIIKGGVNIAPKQIDEVIETHPAVLEAAAVGVPDRYVGEDVVAFAVLRDGMACDERELLSFCEKPLGYFKTPTRIYFVRDLPKGPSGKVQRLRLAEDAERLATTSSLSTTVQSGASIKVSGSGPEPSVAGLSLEENIIEVWSDILGIPQLVPESNFFALGGQSLQAIQCLFHLRERTSILLSLSDFFENATVAQLAALMALRLETASANKKASTASSHGELLPIPQRDRSLPCPLSPAQERIWFMNQLITEEPAYNEAEAVRLKGRLDLDALELAFNTVIERHEILRTTIAARDGRPIMLVHPKWPLTFKRICLRDLGAGEREAKLSQLLIDEPRLPYRLDTEPAVRVTVVELGDEEHAFILMMHHLICDSASLGILWRELATLYEARLRGEHSPLRPLAVQYGDYAVWQRQPSQQERFDEDLIFWKDKLRTAPALLDQPTDLPRPPVFSFRGTKRQFKFDAALANQLRQACREQRISLFTVFATVFNVAMHRYTGQDDILVGVPIADRERPELRPLIGFLLDTHVLRTDLSGDPIMRQLMVSVQQSVASVYSHRATPFDQVVSALKPERNQSYSPVVQVMLNWRDRDDQPQFIGLPGVATEALLAQPKIAKFDLVLTLTDTQSEIHLEIEYCTDLFHEARIEILVGHLRTLLEGVVANSERKVSELPLLSSGERDMLLRTWNVTGRDYPSHQCLHALFEQKVERAPEAVAIVFEDQELTYGELNTRANGVAHRLIDLGVQPSERVGTILARSVDLVVAQLAILKAGATYVPMDPKAPSIRHAWIVEDCAARLLIIDSTTEVSFKPGVPVLRLGANGLDAAEALSINPGRWASSLGAAYVMYTSGSTGTPKGVIVPHRAVTNLVVNNEYAIMDADDRVAFAANPSFDASTFEVWGPLLNGGTLVVISEDTVLTPKDFVRTLLRERVNILWLTVGLLNQLVEDLEPVLAQLRILITGGDVLNPRVISRVLSDPRKRPKELLNGYGPTETTTFATTYRIDSLAHGRIPIGRPISNARTYLLDAYREPVPLGAVGELYIGGAGVAAGYLNRPDLTAERFLVDPFVADPDARMYRTGDLARYLPDGNLVFLGRNDHQVKVRGFRIEPGEVEAVLKTHPTVVDGVVVALGKGSEKRLVAYFVADSDDLDAITLRGHLGAVLPEHMVPAAFVRLDRFPLTANGKVDRRALPPPDDEAYAREAYEKPQGRTETILATIWVEVLGVQSISRRDNFFNLGGHSLLAVKVIGEINKTFKLHLNVPVFFLNPTIAQLATVLEHNEHARPETRVVPLRQGRSGLPVYLMGARPAEYHIAQLIAGDRSIFAIDHRLPTEWRSAVTASNQRVLPTMEQLGELYGDVLFAHVGTSPCVVAGYSVGGKIAFEAARTLQRAGGNAAYVLLIDASTRTLIGPNLGPAWQSLLSIWHGATTPTSNDGSYMDRLSATLSDTWCLVKWTAPRIPGMVESVFDIVMSHLTLTRKEPTSAPEGYFDEEGMPIDKSEVNKLAYAAGRLWRPQPLDTAGVLIRANSAADILPGNDHANGWDGLFMQGLEIVETTGDHSSMLTEENGAALARQLNSTLVRYDVVPDAAVGRRNSNLDRGFVTRQRRLDQASLPRDTVA
jgi:amino acid adenylation domain-containing protein